MNSSANWRRLPVFSCFLFRRCARFAAVALLLPWGLARAAFDAQGSILAVNTARLSLTLEGGTVTGLKNLLTGETYLRPPSTSPTTGLSTVSGGNSLTPGAWIVKNETGTAELELTDGDRTLILTAGTEDEEIWLRLEGHATTPGLVQATLGVRGFDLSAGSFYVAAAGGITLNADSFQSRSEYFFSTTNAGAGHLEAPLSLFQTSAGGVAIYSRDSTGLFHRLALNAATQHTADGALGVEAQAPWAAATKVEPVEWRFAAYRGEWLEGARIYRDWHRAALPPPVNRGESWAPGIRTIVKFVFSPPYENAMLDEIVRRVNPAKTLLYLVNWRKEGYDGNYPDYTPHPSAKALVARAHELGFRVMLHTDMIGVTPTNSDYATVAAFHVREPYSGSLTGWRWAEAADTKGRYAYIDPAASAYRELFIARLRTAVETVAPDALHLDISGWPVNDANGLIEGRNYLQGSAELCRELLAAFPGVALGSEGINHFIAPYISFSQQTDWKDLGFDVRSTPPAPLSAAVLASARPYGHLGYPNPDAAGFLPFFVQYEGQLALPMFSTNYSLSTPTDFGAPEFVRYLRLVDAVQQHDLEFDWETPWNGARARYRGSDGATLTISESEHVMSATLRSGASDTVLYRRAYGVTELTSVFAIPGWPAWRDRTQLGLDPAQHYWLESGGSHLSDLRIAQLPADLRVKTGDGTLYTADFAYVTLTRAPAETPDFEQLFGSAQVGTTYNQIDRGLTNGALAQPITDAVAGETRRGFFLHPPFQGESGGETFMEYELVVPTASHVAVSFAAGILDGASGQRKGPMRFKLRLNDAEVWSRDVSTGTWERGSLDLTSLAGQPVKLRFISHPGPANDTSFAWGVWGDLQWEVTAPDAVAAGIGVQASVASLTAGDHSVALDGSAATIGNLPLPGTIVAFFNPPHAVKVGEDLYDVPFHVSQASPGELAKKSVFPYAGTRAPFAVEGVNKAHAIWANTPGIGSTVLSWPLDLPAGTGLVFSFSSALRDDGLLGSVPASLRVNGTEVWTGDISLPSAWRQATVNLGPWAGRSVVLELITTAPLFGATPVWADLKFTAAPPRPVSSTPTSQSLAPGAATALTAQVSGGAASTVQWQRNGRDLSGATKTTLALSNVQPADTGLYRLVVGNASGANASDYAILGLTSTSKAIGAGEEVGSDIPHPNGNIFDQVLLTGAAEAITADHAQNQITRTSFIDLDDDIVQVEFSGPGTLSLVLDDASGPALPVKYNQSVSYMKGHAGIVITGATEQTNVSVFTVGRATAVNQALFKNDADYDGIADIAFIAIASANGKFGGVRTSNAHYFAAKGLTGLYAPGVAFQGPVFVGEITAFDAAVPVLRLGSSNDVRITGGDLFQENARAVQVSGTSALKFTPGADSHGKLFAARSNRGRLEDNGVDVTAQIVAGP